MMESLGVIFQQENSTKTVTFMNFCFLFIIIKQKSNSIPNGKMMPFGFPCHHVISMRNIYAVAKWPVDKTLPSSDVLFSIKHRQNQNNRTAANKNKFMFPISIPDTAILREERKGSRMEGKKDE